DDLGPALGDDLAALAGHQPGQVVGLALDELGEVVEQVGVVDAAGAAPGGEGGAGGGDGGLGLGLGAAGGDADHLIEAGGVAALEAAGGGSLPAAGDQVTAGDAGGSGDGGHDALLLRGSEQSALRAAKTTHGPASSWDGWISGPASLLHSSL